MGRITKVTYELDHAWLKELATQPGEVWVDNSEGQMRIVHEFLDLAKEQDEVS